MTTTRRGATLLELIVALPIGAIIGAIAISLLLDTHKLSRRLDSSTQIGRELRQAAAVLASEIRPLAASDLIAWTDTSIEVNGLIGSGIVCAVPGTSAVDLMPLNGTDAIRTSWFATPQSGDIVFTQGADSSVTAADVSWRTSSLHSTGTSASSTCIASPHMRLGSAVGNPVRLRITGSFGAPPALGSLVRIARRARHSLYRASDGMWYLGRKSFNGTAWSTIQPVAGPFDKPSLLGLRIEVRDSVNSVTLPAVPATPRSVALVLHASSSWKKSATAAGVRDSVLMHITLRGQMEAIAR